MCFNFPIFLTLNKTLKSSHRPLGNRETLSITTITETTMVVAAELYLPDECWECVFKFLSENRYLGSLSLVSKQFFSITNRFRFSITTSDLTSDCLSQLSQRFPNLTSLNLNPYGNRFCWIPALTSSFRIQFTQTNSLHNSNSSFASTNKGSPFEYTNMVKR